MTVNETCTTKRSRRSKADIAKMRNAIYDICCEHEPLSIRQLFYRMVVAALIDKTEAEYRNVVCRTSGQMREAGELPFEWIIDSSRWMRKPSSHTSLEDALNDTAAYYRRNLWADQDVYVECSCESDSIAGVLYPATAKWDIPLMVSKGFSSKTNLYLAARAIESQGKPAFLYYFGDYDPSGLCITEHIDQWQLEATRRVEEAERDTLDTIIESLEEAA